MIRNPTHAIGPQNAPDVTCRKSSAVKDATDPQHATGDQAHQQLGSDLPKCHWHPHSWTRIVACFSDNSPVLSNTQVGVIQLPSCVLFVFWTSDLCRWREASCNQPLRQSGNLVLMAGKLLALIVVLHLQLISLASAELIFDGAI